jgi:hypothetical protein
MHDSRRYRYNAAECLLAAQHANLITANFVSMPHGSRSPVRMRQWTMLAIPGIGPVVAAGWLAATAAGAVAGSATGGAIGALTQAGVSEEDAMSS